MQFINCKITSIKFYQVGRQNSLGKTFIRLFILKKKQRAKLSDNRKKDQHIEKKYIYDLNISIYQHHY